MKGETPGPSRARPRGGDTAFVHAGSTAEEGLGGCRAVEPLVGAEDEVVREGDLEPSLQVLDGEGTMETKARGVFECSPEAFEPGRGVDVQGGGEALSDTEPSDRLREDPRPELASEVGDEVLRGAKALAAVRQQPGHTSLRPASCSETWRARGTREKASKTPATWKTWRPRNDRSPR